jgi:hypothetical protein
MALDGQRCDKLNKIGQWEILQIRASISHQYFVVLTARRTIKGNNPTMKVIGISI